MDKKMLLAGLISTATLAGCTAKTVTIDDLLQNPLFAERYAESMVDRLVELDITKNPVLEDPAKKAFVETQRKHWLEVAREAREEQREGTTGNLVPINEYAKGDFLYIDGTLYAGTLFEIDPLPGLHMYLTTVVDPRDVEFPDDTAMDLGPIQTAYGAHAYEVPSVENPLLYRTVVLWDDRLGRLHSFVQLNK